MFNKDEVKLQYKKHIKLLHEQLSDIKVYEKKVQNYHEEVLSDIRIDVQEVENRDDLILTARRELQSLENNFMELLQDNSKRLTLELEKTKKAYLKQINHKKE